MSKDKTNQNGITLIALVITIIVMLILVGVSVTVALNGGLFSTAKQATNRTQLELDKEQLLSAAIGAIGEDGKVDFTKLELLEGFTKTAEKTYTSKAGNTFTVSDYGSVTEVTEGGADQEPGDENGANPSEPTEPENPTGYAAYSVGDTVTIGTEIFYVLKDSDATQETVTLLAKDNIDTTNLVQSASAGRVAFSTESYWGSGTSPYDIEETTPIPESHTAAKAAYDYGAKIGGTGRLMTHSEATALKSANSDILYGKNGKSSGTYLNYWLGSANDTRDVWYVYGDYSRLLSCAYDDVFSYGVRPVVEISKSSIS